MEAKVLRRSVLVMIVVLGLLLAGNESALSVTFGLQNFNGRYTTSTLGFDSSITGTASEPNPPAIPLAESEVLNADGNGNLSGEVIVDYGAPGTGAPSDCFFTGTYTVDPSSGKVTVMELNTGSCAPGGTVLMGFLSWPSGKRVLLTKWSENPFAKTLADLNQCIATPTGGNPCNANPIVSFNLIGQQE